MKAWETKNPKIEEHSIPVQQSRFAALWRARAVMEGETVLLAVLARTMEGDMIPAKELAPLAESAQSFLRALNAVPALNEALKAHGYESFEKTPASLQQLAERSQELREIPLVLVLLLVVGLDALADQVQALLMAFDVRPDEG